ncbi:hypothetical protein K458DRAFT_329471, partial [Lentithecium fluviatile CBS 122367]
DSAYAEHLRRRHRELVHRPRRSSPFDAHIEILCAASPFFGKALDGRFIEAETKYIPLLDEDPCTFAEFLSWAYTGQFTFKVEFGGVGWKKLCELWILGDKFQIPALQNAIIPLLAQKYDIQYFPSSKGSQGNGNIHLRVISYVYSNTACTSPLRRAITDI